MVCLFQNSDHVGEGISLLCLLYNADSAIPIPDLNILVHSSSKRKIAEGWKGLTQKARQSFPSEVRAFPPYKVERTDLHEVVRIKGIT